MSNFVPGMLNCPTDVLSFPPPPSPFLKYVSDTKSFDDRIRDYIGTQYAQQQSVWPNHTHAEALQLDMLTCRRYENILGCSSVNLTNTTSLYARYTTTVLCNAIIQSSKTACGLIDRAATPLCAGACVCALCSPPSLMGKC